MTSLVQPPARFRERARITLGRKGVQEMIDSGTAHLFARRLEAWADLPDVEATRERAREIRTRTIGDLDRYLADFGAALGARGGNVVFCRSAEEARRYIVDVCVAHDAKLVAKTKSMATRRSTWSRRTWAST